MPDRLPVAPFRADTQHCFQAIAITFVLGMHQVVDDRPTQDVLILVHLRNPLLLTERHHVLDAYLRSIREIMDEPHRPLLPTAKHKAVPRKDTAAEVFGKPLFQPRGALRTDEFSAELMKTLMLDDFPRVIGKGLP